jgi:hypothetical protein
MLLDGDDAALQAYLEGDRTTELVVGYYRRLGLGGALDEMTAGCTESRTPSA